MLKFVIQSIPAYLMGVYKFSNFVIKEISSAMARFFWRKSGTQHKLRWNNWNVMCTPKPFEWMRFKDLSIFNDALFWRQAWRLIQKEDSLWERVMKTKYYSKCDFINASLDYAGSYSWRSIWSSKTLSKEGIIWHINKCSSVNIWKDPWVSDEEGRFITSTEVQDIKQVIDQIWM